MERAAGELCHVLYNRFSMHPARGACFLALIWSVIGAKTVQIWALAERFGGKAQADSRAKRISRFFRLQVLCFDSVARAVMDLLCPAGKLTLVMDRTNWEFGKISRNYLALSVVFHGNAVPILLKDLGRAGNSETGDRIALLERFVRLFGKERIFCLLADREFIGREWFSWLKENDVPACVRVKNNMQVRHKNGGRVAVKTLLRSLAVGEYREWDEKLYGFSVRMVGLALPDGDFLVLLADERLSVDLLPLYKLRRTIECMFKNAKSSGFNLEKTHLVHLERAEKLFAVVALAVAVSLKEGAIQNALKPIPFKKTLNAKAVSVFSYGFKYCADAAAKIANFIVNPLVIFGIPHAEIQSVR